MDELDEQTEEKLKRLQTEITSKSKLLVAYSGGVDSALLAKIANDQLGANAWAVIIDSETVPRFELEEAKSLAGNLGINFKIIHVTQLSDTQFTKNDANRCYFCRSKMAEELLKVSKYLEIETIAAGAQASDLDDYRPGIKAFSEAGIWHPFIDLDISKDEIRAMARYLDIHVSEKPSMACLSSRIQYGQEITDENLERVSAAEDYLRELGFKQYRARTHDNLIRIEVEEAEFDLILEYKNQIIKKMKEIGYKYVTLNLEGFQSGSMNRVLSL